MKIEDFQILIFQRKFRNMKTKISLKKELGENLITRNSLISFFKEKVDNFKDDKIVMDFKNVKFISRSCAAEYIKLRENFGKDIKEINMSDEIKAMFRLVINQLKNSNFKLTKDFINISSI